MTAAYGNETWHYTHPNGHVPDLHILLAGKVLGGGNQYLSPCCGLLLIMCIKFPHQLIIGVADGIGALCHPLNGFAINSGIVGSLQNITDNFNSAGDTYWQVIHAVLKQCQ